MRQSVLRVKGPWSVKSRGLPEAPCPTGVPDLCRHMSAGKAAGTSAAAARKNSPSGLCGRGSSTARAVSNKNDLQKGRAVSPPLRVCFASVGHFSRGPGHALGSRSVSNAAPGVASHRRRLHKPAGRAPIMPIRAAGSRSFPKRQLDRTFAVGR